MNTYQEEQLAEKIRLALDLDHSLTVPGICLAVEAEEIDVFRILDEYEVVDGSPQYRGPGQGGGWVAPEYQTAFQPVPPEDLGVHIGWRWPDGSIRPEQFVRDDPEHVNALSTDDSGE